VNTTRRSTAATGRRGSSVGNDDKADHTVTVKITSIASNKLERGDVHSISSSIVAAASVLALLSA
jgi:hypothetical protein